MEFFVAQVTLVLPLVGFDLFRKAPLQAPPSAGCDVDADALFVFATSGASATARETDDGFVVLAGSTARRTPAGRFRRDIWRCAISSFTRSGSSKGRRRTSSLSPGT